MARCLNKLSPPEIGMLVHKLSEPLECQGSKYRHHTLDTEHHSPLTRLIFSLGWYNCGNGDHTISLSSSHPAGFRTSANITYRSALVLSEGKRKRCCVTGSEVTSCRIAAAAPAPDRAPRSHTWPPKSEGGALGA